MTTTLDVLDQISDTLRDAEVGPNAHPVDGGWTPGEPLWPHPWLRGADAQVTREMVQLIPDYERPMRCQPCGVDWAGDAPCWMCNEDRPMRHGVRQDAASRLTTVAVRIDVRPYLEAMNAMAEQLRRVGEAVVAGGGWARLRQIIAQLGRPLERRHDEHHPQPLCIDGAAYARRRAARRRR